MNFVDALAIANKVMDDYKRDHLRWWKRMDGTPILNDLPVRMAAEFALRTAETLPADLANGAVSDITELGSVSGYRRRS